MERSPWEANVSCNFFYSDELHLKSLRRDPTNNAPYNYLAMAADEADPLVHFAQVAALATLCRECLLT
jgi:hypothetical protein